MPPRIAFCTTVKGRAQHLKLTLPKNLADNPDPNSIFIVLDYGSQDDLIPYIKEHHVADIAAGRLAVYSRVHDGPFHMAHAKNVAHRLGLLHGADVLVNLDADNYAGAGFARYCAEFFGERSESAFLWACMVKGNFRRGISGRIAVTRNAYLKAGGYDERFDGWGPDDKDFNFRLRRLGYDACEIPPEYLDSVSHNDKMRFREYQYLRGSEQDYAESPGSYGPVPAVANFGRFGCTPLWRSLDPAYAFTLPALPTRVFGIGLHKTGTVSLHQALKLLGLDCAHWPSAHWAKAVWTEMRAEGRSRTLERHYAACDLPLPLLYRELDSGYPGSKFILTVREEGAWIESVRRHWDATTNPFRTQWDRDPFTHRVHREIYGRKGFDEAVMLERYRRHNAAVCAYFKYRPQDLLVLDVDDGMKWGALCGFLGMAVPAAEYPRANESSVNAQ